MNDKINKEPKEEGIELMEIFEMIKAKSKTIKISLIVAFIVALIAIKSFIDYLSRKGFKIFGYYRIILGITLLIIHFFIYRLTI